MIATHEKPAEVYLLGVENTVVRNSLTLGARASVADMLRIGTAVRWCTTHRDQATSKSLP